MKKLDSYEIAHLPTLDTVVNHFKEEEQDFLDNGGWWSDSRLNVIPPDACWHFPNMDYRNNASDDKFIITQTVSKRHTLKPNLRLHCFLYRGQNRVYDNIISSFGREELDKGNPLALEEYRKKHLLSNLKAEEFMALLKTHPLFMMLDRGIVLAPERRPIFINMNYYGLAQHYNFHTGLIDFTSDIESAAFFACTQNNGDDQYEPITDTNKYPYGVLYVHRINPELTFKFWGFSTIGLQLYPRTGAQKGYCYNEGKMPTDVNSIVEKVLFKHDPFVSKKYCERKKNGSLLFPTDSISKYAKEILNGNEISGATFIQNLYSNQDSFDENMQVLQQNNISVNWHKQMHFTGEMLQDLGQDLKNGLWEEFCKQIYIPDENKGKEMHESLLNLPKNPAYSHYFNINEYERITYYDSYLHKRAKNIQ